MDFGCGKCVPCRINKRRKWVARMMLELMATPSAIFVTLTYDEENLPEGATLVPKDLTDFFKLLRYYLPNRTIRYFAVGEYGDQNWRPHYHLIIYGVDIAESDVLLKAWKKGIVHVGTAEPDSMQYVAGYVTKKMTNKKDKRLAGRHPEFARMSRRPGIGQVGVERFAAAILSNRAAVASLMDGSWLPTVFHTEKKKAWPLDRFLKLKLYQALKLTEGQVKAYNRRAVVKEWAIKMSMPTEEYERIRKGKVIAQRGRLITERRRDL